MAETILHHPTSRLREWGRLVAEDGFAVSILAIVAVAAVIALGFGATPGMAPASERDLP